MCGGSWLGFDDCQTWEHFIVQGPANLGRPPDILGIHLPHRLTQLLKKQITKLYKEFNLCIGKSVQSLKRSGQTIPPFTLDVLDQEIIGMNLTVSKG